MGEKEIIGTISTVVLVVMMLVMLAGNRRAVRRQEQNYDERQLIEQGRASRLSMGTAMLWMLIVIILAESWETLEVREIHVLLLLGLAASMLVYDGYCILHDAYVGLMQSGGKKGWIYSALLGVLWLSNAWMNWMMDGELDLRLVLGIVFMVRALGLLFHGRRSRRDNADG